MPHFEPEGYILEYGQMRKQGIILKDEIHGPMVGSDGLHRAAFDQNLALIGLLETGKQAQGRSFAGPAGADEGKELGRPYGKRAAVHGQSGAMIFDEISYFDAIGTQGGTTRAGLNQESVCARLRARKRC